MGVVELKSDALCTAEGFQSSRVQEFKSDALRPVLSTVESLP